MRLSADRFYKSSVVLLGHDGKRYPAEQYTYETHNAIYDIAIVDGSKLYSKNMGAWSNRIDAIKPIHYEIERHFAI